mmetsp:Transcript_30840/g.50946  ORF Transcript_30840/g.50946 Transcript_30840/m.50946 type:complete len:379 (-) Transcript_30840:114-1250(-)|eukprot:CAMPEP_0119015046 /NCGR_PEP_ID=MMETSP1176-20130426/10526_1 /TAXON_ID=265551 /ORGANISM="Synedropsis recta cf, Strain CCMP1620" /LENGTH=378 /DNA_ID=CAMNT_0006968305 /DNA_START=58 /DNA_END=1194 /DNA_ORIENTATION=+
MEESLLASSNNNDGAATAASEQPISAISELMQGAVEAFEQDPKLAALPRVLLMGPRRGGKTSIQRVVFSKMSPHETLFRLEATQGLERAVVDHTPLCQFTIWDFPGDYYGEQPEVFAGTTSLIFVMDAQDEPYDHVLQSFTDAVTRAVQVNPHITIEVFINKVDGELFLSDESKYDCRRDIMAQVTDELEEAGVRPEEVSIRYHLTSIYDHSIYEALSRVVQRLIPQLPTLENLLNVLVSTCSMEKAYLFDVVSKLYVSTDSSPVDMQSVELCSDMIDVVLDVSGIYGLGPPEEEEPSELIDPDSAYDRDSASVIRLSNGMVLYLKEVDTMLALVCITRGENFRKKSLINYNIRRLKQALRSLSSSSSKPMTNGNQQH